MNDYNLPDSPAGVREALARTVMGSRAYGLGDACMVRDPQVAFVWAVRDPRPVPPEDYLVYLRGPDAVWGPGQYGRVEVEDAVFDVWPPRSRPY